MKIFLITSIIAMISAGIYGSIDLARDINQGTLIQYEKGDAREIKLFAGANKNLSVLASNIKVETKKEEKETKTKVSDLKIEYFSRGEPPRFSSLEELVIPDSANQRVDSVAVIPVTSVPFEKRDTVRASAILSAKEERRFSPKLFSRSKPRPFVKEIPVAQIDTLEKE